MTKNEDQNERYKLIKFWMDEVDLYMRENDFQRAFFESLLDQFNNGFVMSEKQQIALEKIYKRVTQ